MALDSITLTTPIVKTATKVDVRDIRFDMSASIISVKYNLVDANGNILTQDNVIFRNFPVNDYAEIMGELIASKDVGDTVEKVLRSSVKKKLKSFLGA